MEAIISPIVEKIFEYTVAPVGRQFGYLIRYKSKVTHLANKAKQLCKKRDDVNMVVEPAEKALKTIGPRVKPWLEEVQKIMEEKERRFEEESVATKSTCRNGWFPNLKGRYSLGRKAKKMTLVVKELLDRDLGTIVHPAPPPEVEFPPTEDPTQLPINIPEGASSSDPGTSNHTSAGGNIDFKSRRSTIRDVMEALKGNQISLIVICGMGGVGKTTLVGQVVNRAKREGIFAEYTGAVVTETPDLNKIQRDVAEYLGLSFEGEELKARAFKLRKRLSGTKRVLVVLDNVWTNLNLWEIGIPCDPKTCKILVTSRNQDVFNEMEETRKKFPIGGLPESDAWSLFKKVAGGYNESDPELLSIAEKVLRECDGLPVAISTLGSALRQKKKSVWKDALGKLQKPFGGDIPGMEKNVYQTIRLSYRFLDGKEARSCFLLCCVFPESTDIRIEDLVTHGLGLGLFQGIDSVEGGRDRVEALLDTLKSCYLLLDSDKDEHVRIHDVVRAVGLYIASDEGEGVGTFLVRHGVTLEGWPQRYTCTSLTVRTNRTSPELLLLSRTNKKESSSLEISGALNGGVEDLKVLDISVPVNELSMVGLTSLPVLSKNIQTLCLKGLKLELQTISMIGELRTLMILRLSGSTIKHVPEEFKNLCNLKFLDLAHCRELKKISPGIISSLSKLEELYLWGSLEKWDDAGIIGLSSELLDLPLLTRLETKLPPVDILRIKSVSLFDKLKRFKLNIPGRKIERKRRGEMTKKIVEYIFERSYLLLGVSTEFGRRTKLPKNSGGNYLILENLDADALAAVTQLLKETHVLELKMNSSNDVAIQHLFGHKVDLPVLKRLHIEKMCNFEEIWNNQLSPYSFCELRQLQVESCDKISHLVPTYMQARLQKLETLHVSDCSSLQEIFGLRRSRVNEDEGSRQTPSNISQPDQGIMQIRNQMDFKVLQHLTNLIVRRCDSLRKVCSSSIARSLVNLKELDIRECGNMEEIVAAEEGEEAEDNNTFPHLRRLSLCGLPNLVSFSRDTYALDWPSMEYIDIENCSKMKNFCSGSLTTPMEMKIYINSGVDENIRSELAMSKKEKPHRYELLDP